MFQYPVKQTTKYLISMIGKDTIEIATANIITPVAVGITLMNPVTILTIVSILSSIILNGVLIYKNLNKKNYQDTTEQK
jgi:hypothetical protein